MSITRHSQKCNPSSKPGHSSSEDLADLEHHLPICHCVLRVAVLAGATHRETALKSIDVDASHHDMGHKVNAHRSLWIVRCEREIGRLLGQMDDIAQFLLHGFPYARSFMHISSASYGATFQGKLDGARQEDLDASHGDIDLHLVLAWLDRGAH